MKKLGIYIHIPFCRRKCNYCGFYSKPVDFSDSADDEKTACIGTGNGENLCAGTGNGKNLYAGTDDEKAAKARGLVDACVQAPEISYVQRLVATIRERGAKYGGNRMVDRRRQRGNGTACRRKRPTRHLGPTAPKSPVACLNDVYG